jgi:hypothetical protein
MQKKKIVISLIILIIAAAAGVLWYSQKLSEESRCIKKDLSPQYKNFKLLSLIGEVPINWSILRIPESIGNDKLSGLPTGAIGKTEITHGDINGEQVNFYFVSQDIVDSLIQESKADKYNKGYWDAEMIGGIKAEVNIFPLDENGNVSKGDTGGKKYYFKFPSKNIKTLVIWKQTKGNEEFEEGFQHFINSIYFQHD